jgi:hypothetical protein
MIEFLASIDPVSLPVVAALLFSLTLYPLGLMLGSSCSPCCDTPCTQCETGKLPDTVTVTFDGYPDVGPAFDALFVSLTSCYGSGATATPTTAGGVITAITVTNGGSGHATLARVEPTITADGSGGSGADITVTLTEDEDECGLPYWTITGLTVVDGGSGYTDGGEIVFTIGEDDVEQEGAFALIQTGRDEPELTIEPPEDSGTGATFTVAVAVVGTTPQTWYISGVTVTNGGTGYSDGEFASVVLGSGDVEQVPAELVIRTVRGEPELTLSGPADLTVNVASLGDTPEVWEISSITVNDGGSGYSDGQSLNIILGPDDVDATGSGAYLVVNTVRDEPTLFAQDQPGSGGSGAVLVVNVVQSGNVWVVNSITVTNGGTGYTGGETFDILPSSGQTVSAASVTVNVTGGVITGANINDAGEYFFDTGVIDTVDVQGPGLFFRDTGVIDSIDFFDVGMYYKVFGDIENISLANGGKFYGEDADAPALVADITVVLDQIAPSDGDGATFTVNVDDDPESPTFGEVVSVTVDDGGDGYEATGANNSFCMGEYMNGRSFVLARAKFFPLFSSDESSGSAGHSRSPCQYVTRLCTPLTRRMSNFETIVFEYRAGNYASGSQSVLAAPRVSLTTNEAIADCDEFTMEFPANSQAFPAYRNVTATVVSGGGSVEDATTPIPVAACHSCCVNQDAVPTELTVSVDNLLAPDGPVPDGDYVLAIMSQSQINFFSLPEAVGWIGGDLLTNRILVFVEPCAGILLDQFQRPYWAPRDGCGDTCNTKCKVRMSLSDNNGSFSHFYDPGCDCSDSPICSPPAGEYETTASFNPAVTQYRVTVQ